jgi:hypothetical protein
MFTIPRRAAGALLLLGAGLLPAHAQTNRYAAADDSPDNSAHALDALSSAANKAPSATGGEAATRAQLAALQARLETFIRQSSAATDDNRAALADIHARLDGLQQQLNREQQPRGGDDPRVDALTQRLAQDERIIAQLRAQPAAAPAPVAAARPTAVAPAAAGAVPAASAAPISCSDLDAGKDAAWSAAVAKAYPGYSLDSVDVGADTVSIRRNGDRPRQTTASSVMQSVGCS